MTPTPLRAAHYTPIEGYALLSDCASSALVSTAGAIDWCCMPGMSDDPCFGRLLDWARGGHCSICPDTDEAEVERRYDGESLVLRTTFTTPQGRAELCDFLAMPEDEAGQRPQLLGRHLRCTEGQLAVRIDITPRFDFGEILPAHDLRLRGGQAVHLAYGGNQGLLIVADAALSWCPQSSRLHATRLLKQGESLRLSMRFVPPEHLEREAREGHDSPDEVDRALARTLAWWRRWWQQADCPAGLDAATRRSAVILKGLSFERTGAMAAAATTSLPEVLGGERNWDYRFSWIRDTALAVRALHLLGIEREAGRFNSFTERTAAGSASELQIMYGLDGRRRLTEICLDWLDGYRGARPVRVGNMAAQQTQHDIYGSLLEVACLWHTPERPLNASYWDFLVDVVNTAVQRWQEPDFGIWEFRDQAEHFVHSKVMCWVAVDRGLTLARRHGLSAPEADWRAAAQAMREGIDRQGYDAERGVYLQAYGQPHMDAALLLLPHFGYITADDPRMVRTTDEICRQLAHEGLLWRYRRGDGLGKPEGAFLPCTFWLAECLALQGRQDEAWRYYRRALSCANDLSLLSEDYDSDHGHMLGNFPQALTHLAQITARLALD